MRATSLIFFLCCSFRFHFLRFLFFFIFSFLLFSFPPPPFCFSCFSSYMGEDTFFCLSSLPKSLGECCVPPFTTTHSNGEGGEDFCQAPEDINSSSLSEGSCKFCLHCSRTARQSGLLGRYKLAAVFPSGWVPSVGRQTRGAPLHTLQFGLLLWCGQSGPAGRSRQRIPPFVNLARRLTATITGTDASPTPRSVVIVTLRG